MVVHADHHRNEYDRVVEEMQFDAWEPQLQNARRNRPSEQVVPDRRLNNQQQVFDVMPELNAERNRPPAAICHAGKPGPERPQPNQHHERIAVVENFGFHEPRIIQAEQTQRFGHWPSEHVNLKRLEEMLAPMREHDDREYPQRELVILTVQPVEKSRFSCSNRVGVSRVHAPSSIGGDSDRSAIVQMHYLSSYPELPAARDRFIVDLRGPRPAYDPFRYQGVSVEDELNEHGERARVGTVFLTGRECPWRCAMCDLWRSTTQGDTPAGAIPAQLRTARNAWRDAGEPIARVKLYNASNFFDPRAVPESDYAAIAEELADIEQVIVESHPSLVGPRVDRFRATLAGPSLEVAMGLETAHPAALAALNKRMTTDDFERAATVLRHRAVSVRVFLLIHPPFIPADAQDEWLLRSVSFAIACGASVISLVPTRGGNGAMEALARQGLFRAPAPADIARSVDLVHSRITSDGAHSVRILLDPWAADAR
jgi:archaeosine synthase beta-subunit